MLNRKNALYTAAQTQSIENELAWWRIEPKNSPAFRWFCFQHFNYSTAASLWK